jgi:uncharacterized membrane protein (DUF485 family)
MVKRGKRVRNIQKKKGNSLDKIVNLAVIAVAFFCSFIYLSADITGNTILSTSFKLSNIVGAGLFIAGIVASFIYFERKK